MTFEIDGPSGEHLGAVWSTHPISELPSQLASGHPITLNITTGRSGSSFIANSFNESLSGRASVYHETLTVREGRPAHFHRAFDGSRLEEMAACPPIANVTDRFEREAQTRPVIDFGWTMSSLVPLFYRRFGSRLRVIVQYRHPVAAAASMAALGLYSNYPRPWEYMLGPWNDGARFKHLGRNWDAMSEYERCLYRWYELYEYGREAAARFPDIPFLFLNSDRMFKDASALSQVATFCGLPNATVSPSPSRNENRLENLETNPIGAEWRRTRDYREIVDLGEHLGFDFSDETILKLVSKYRLPEGLGAKLRHETGYWLKRRKIKKFIKKSLIR